MTRYPPKIVEFARRLAENGYRVYEIQAALAKRGYHPHEVTVARWADPEYAEARRIARRRRRNGRLTRGPRASKLRLARLHELRALGISHRGIAVVMNHDHGLVLTADNVRGIVNGTMTQGNVKAAMLGERVERGARAYRMAA